MDDSDAISRREAIVGLAVLGSLALGMTSVIVLRILHAAPQQGAVTEVAPWVRISPPSEIDMQITEAPFPTVIPTSADGDETNSISGDSTTEVVQRETTEPLPKPASPTFVSPGGR